MKNMKRVNFYIDGFNLYFGILNGGYNHCKWLDIYLLAETLKNNSYSLKKVKYFRTNWMKCNNCGGGWYDSKEKKTDVNIATHLIKDTYGSFTIGVKKLEASQITPDRKN